MLSHEKILKRDTNAAEKMLRGRRRLVDGAKTEGHGAASSFEHGSQRFQPSDTRLGHGGMDRF
jgi:hypothetical protein